MKFEIAISNGLCYDGEKVVNSVKAAYLYADKVRVYDYSLPQDYRGKDILKCEFDNPEFNKIYNHKKRILKDYLDSHDFHNSEKKYFCYGFGSGAINDLDSKVNAITESQKKDSYELGESIIAAIRIIHDIRELLSEQYKREYFQRVLTHLGIDYVRPLLYFKEDMPIVVEPIIDFTKSFFDDTGFKLINDNPINDYINALDSSLTSIPLSLSEYAISSLPGFEEASFDEIIDIRKELDKYIIPYRSAILRMAQKMKEMPIQGSYQQDCAYLYFQEIEPQVASINAAIHDNNVFKNIAKNILTDGKAWTAVGALAAVIASTGEIANAICIGTAATFGGLSIAEGIKKSLDEKKKIKGNEMYFLYETGNRLRNPKLTTDLRDVTGLPD